MQLKEEFEATRKDKKNDENEVSRLEEHINDKTNKNNEKGNKRNL